MSSRAHCLVGTILLGCFVCIAAGFTLSFEDLGAAAFLPRGTEILELRNEHARLYERQRPEVRDPATLPAIPVRGYDTSTEAFALRRALDDFGVGEVGIIGKAHPECVTPELARELRRLGEPFATLRVRSWIAWPIGSQGWEYMQEII